MDRTINFQGEKVAGTIVDFKAIEEPWATYELDDGTVLKIKLVAREIMRINTKKDNLGNPTYLVESQNVMAPPKCPSHLIKEPETKG